jgi:dUTP pyrophosphatase
MTLFCVDPFEFLCEPAYDGDIGLDLKACSEPLIVGHRLRDNEWKHIDYIEYDTGVQIQLSPHCSDRAAALLFPRSSISRHNLVLANSVGVIDPGYRDTVKVRFKYVPQPSDYIIFEKWLILSPALDRIYQRGDKIAQLVFPALIQPEIKRVETLPYSERGKGGFGSSGN